MEITEQEIAEAFGVELDQDASAGTGAAREETEVEAREGQEAQEETREEAREEQAAQEETREEQADGGTPGRRGTDLAREMSAEERHRQASARRAREEEARAAAEQDRVDRIYADMFRGQVSPYTGKPIRTEAEYKAYQSERQRREQAEQLERAGIAPETIASMVEAQVAPMRERMEQAEMAAMRERARVVNERAEQAVQTAMRNIAAMDPSIKTLEDIAAMPTAGRFNALVQKGIGLEDAFFLANRQAVESRKAAAAAAAARKEAGSRQHLDPIRSGGGRLPVEVPAEQAEMFREMMPGATDADIRKAYEGYLKNLK